MNKVFYGICNSGEGEFTKDVIVSDIELLEEDFTFEEGDLLTVFFAQGNIVDAPTLAIYVNDTDEEVSTTVDSGKFVKTHDVVADAAEAWGAGETVIFAYTKLGNYNTHYWEIIDAVHASNQLYGVTKLFDDSVTDQAFSDWIKGDIEDEDSNIALTPNALKRLYNLLSGKSTDDGGGDEGGGDEGGDDEDPIDPEPDSEPDEPLIGLTWTEAPEMVAYETDNLGTLSLTGDSDGIVITYPIRALIEAKMGNVSVPTHTGQLINNGKGPGVQDSDPFITKKVPDNLYFNKGNGLYYNSIPRLILNDGSNRIAIGNASDNTLTAIYLAKPVTVADKMIISKNGIAVSGNSTITGNLNISGGGYAKILYENGTSLEAKYSKKLRVWKWNFKTGSISKNSSSGHKVVNVPWNGYTPIGVVGYNISYNGSNTGDAKYANLWECFLLNNSQVQYDIYNMHSKAINVQIDIYVLYVAN